MTNPKTHALFHHIFVPNVDTAACDANLRGRKGSVASCGGLEAWHFLGWNSNEWPCSFCLPLMCCLLSESEVWDARAARWECECAAGSVPSCRHTVCQAQYYKPVVELCAPVCLFSGKALQSFRSSSGLRPTRSIGHLTCLSGNQRQAPRD